MNAGRLPDFIIAGAPRCGTTSLARYLGAHPFVYMAEEKEVRFFDDNYAKGLTWYTSKFSEAAENALCGEASPWYMFNPTTLERLARHLPSVKLIVSFREPCDRLWSHFWMRRERGLESRSFDEVLDSEFRTFDNEGELSTNLFYLRGSLYAPHLRSVFDRFPSTSVTTVVFEQLVIEPENVYQDICQQLGVDPEYRPENLGKNINAFVRFRSTRLRNLAKRSGIKVFDQVVGRLNVRTGASYPKLPPPQKTRLTEFFGPYNDKLESLAGVDLSAWR